MPSTTRTSPTLAARVAPAKVRWGTALVYGGLIIALVIVIAVPDRAEEPGFLAMMIGYGAAGVTLLRKAWRMEVRERLSWVLIGTGFLTAAAGIAAVGIVQTVTGSIPAFGPTDLLFIAAYASILMGFGTMPQLPTSTTQRIRVYLDSLIGALSIAAVMWVLVLSDLIQEFSIATNWDRWAGSAYPILDVASLMMVVIVAVRRSTFRFDARLLLIALGITAQSIADLTYLTSGIGKTFAEASPIYPVYILATVLYLSGALIVDRYPRRRAYADRKAPLWWMISPYSVALALVAMLVVKVDGQELATDALVLLYAVLVVGGLVTIRQTMAIRENRLLVEKQRAELVSSISHELRTPLTAVVGFLDVINDDQTPLDDAERKDLIGVVQRQAQHMSTIVSDLILLARGSSDDMTLKEEVVPVSQVVENAIHAIDRLSVTFNTEVDPDLLARVDPGRVQQILINLLTNADRYGNGTGLIVVRREGSDLTIEVHDDGPGVPKKYEQTIWERFERGVNRLNASIPGSGIGLAVVAAITSAHGGSTGYRRSERLGGACFRVVLPNRIEGQVLMGM